jgi:hypothetical protein
VKIANCKIWFSIIIFSNLATVFVDSEVSFAMSSTTSILGFDGDKDKKENGSPSNNTNNNSLHFECYYCQFKTDIKPDYERHVVQAHPKKSAILARWNWID